MSTFQYYVIQRFGVRPPPSSLCHFLVIQHTFWIRPTPPQVIHSHTKLILSFKENFQTKIWLWKCVCNQDIEKTGSVESWSHTQSYFSKSLDPLPPPPLRHIFVIQHTFWLRPTPSTSHTQSYKTHNEFQREFPNKKFCFGNPFIINA